MANEGYHEPIEKLSAATMDMHRAIVSLMEELEAVDWYNQRVDACSDAELKRILAHNRDEEKSTLLWCWSGSGAMIRPSPTSSKTICLKRVRSPDNIRNDDHASIHADTRNCHAETHSR